MRTIADYNFAGQKALMRVDFNVPLLKDLSISDNTRIKAALPSIRKIINDGGSVVLMSHLGRPKGEKAAKYSLGNIVGELSALLVGQTIQFVEDTVGEVVQAAVANLESGDILLLENTRFYKEEKKGDEAFAQQLANLGCDVYVNDAFGTAHRAHASTCTVAKYFEEGKKMVGFLLQAELENAARIMNEPARPFTAILGGAKVSDKILLIENLLDKVDTLVIGGGMAYTFAKAMGGNIGRSICENDKLDLALSLMQKAKEKGVNFVLPTDNLCADDFSNDANTQVCSTSDIPDGWEGLDIGPESQKAFTAALDGAKSILWNGPMGVFEFETFQSGTISVAQAVKEATAQGGFSLVGGGDSVAAIKKLGFEEAVSYVSTGGGAMLELLQGAELPGVAAIGA